MPPSEIRKEARESLKCKWGKAVCIVLAYTIITFLIGFIEGIMEEESIPYLLLELTYMIISVPLSFGLIISFIKLKRGETISAFGFIKEGFSRFGKSWGLSWHTFIRLLLPTICLIIIAALMNFLLIFGSTSLVLSIICVILYIITLIYVVSRSLLYILTHYIAYDKPQLSSKECVKKSEELMKGNRGSYLLLELSFIGWAILAVLPLGIGILWLTPYLAVAEVCFYERLSNPKNKKNDEEAQIDE